MNREEEENEYQPHQSHHHHQQYQQDNLKLPHVNHKQLIEAYSKKQLLNENKKKKNIIKQRELSPVRYYKDNISNTTVNPKLYHTMNCLNTNNSQNNIHEQHQPVYLCNETQKKLAEVNSYTGMYKKRFDPHEKIHSSGEVCESPVRAIRMLNSTSVGQLNIPARSGDFRNEVEWRLQLRPQFN